jgi:hypothetical protein
MLNAALAGFGLVPIPEDLVRRHLVKQPLTRVLQDITITQVDDSLRRRFLSFCIRVVIDTPENSPY